MSRITISGNDLFQMDLGHLHHSVAGEFVIRKKLDPVAVLDLGLGQALRAALKVVGIGDRQLRLRLAATCCERKGYSQNYNENLYCFHATRPKPSADGLSPLSTFWAGVLYYKCEHGSNC